MFTGTMRRVFAIDVLECAECRARMRILAATHSDGAIRAIPECLGLPSRVPPVGAAADEGEEDGLDAGEDPHSRVE